jgi:nucleoid DNA-binding protein
MAPAMKAMKKAAGTRAMTGGDIQKTIAQKTGLKAKDVKGVFGELQTIAYGEVAKTEKFVIPQLVMLKLKHKKATKAGTREMFGKVMKMAAKPAKKIVKAFPAKPLKDSI